MKSSRPLARLAGLLLSAAALALVVQGAQAKAPPQSHPHPEFLPQDALRRTGQWIQGGFRMERISGNLRVSRQSFQAQGEPQGQALPKHLGGGYLFYQRIGGAGATVTALYRADSWTGALRPLSRLPFPVRKIEPGFDRLYLMGESWQIALDISSGKPLPLEPLPPVVAIEELEVDGPRRALLQAPLVGVLYTADAGMSWRKIAGAYKISRRSADGLWVVTEDGHRRVQADGSLDSRYYSARTHRRSWTREHPSTAGFDASALRAILARGVIKGTRAYGISGGQLFSSAIAEPLELSEEQAVVESVARLTSIMVT